MISKLKNLFKKKSKPESLEQFNTFSSVFDNNEFSKYLEDKMREDDKKALEELEKLEPETLKIMEDLSKETLLKYYCFSNDSKLEFGKVIDSHIKKLLFKQKIKGIMNE